MFQVGVGCGALFAFLSLHRIGCGFAQAVCNHVFCTRRTRLCPEETEQGPWEWAQQQDAAQVFAPARSNTAPPGSGAAAAWDLAAIAARHGGLRGAADESCDAVPA